MFRQSRNLDSSNLLPRYLVVSSTVTNDEAEEYHPVRISCLTPGEGGGFCPRRLWTLITFLILEQTLPNLATFSKNYLGRI